MRACDGHTSTQAGCKPLSTRWWQNVHFSMMSALRTGCASPDLNAFNVGGVAPALADTSAPDEVQPGMAALLSVQKGSVLLSVAL
jgi:hypothetical protein